MKKRGLSPIVATMLLIAIGLVLAMIIFIWARSFIGEQAQKDGRAAALSCEDISFSADVSSPDSVTVENTGAVPIYAVKILKVTSGDREIIEESVRFNNADVLPGSVGTQSIRPNFVSTGNDLLIVPIVLGETSSNSVPVECDDAYGVQISVS